jgi:hypothetical protein
MGDSYEVPRSWIPHDHGGFLFLLRLHVVIMGGYPLASAVIMVVGGGYLLPRTGLHVESS